MKNNNFFGMKIAIFACVAIVSIFLMYKRSSQATVRKTSDELVIGMMSGWVPFMSVNEDGKFEGFDVDVAQELAQKMDKKLVVKDFGSLAPLFVALEQGSIDMIMSGLDITESRLKKLSMVKYIGGGFKSFCLLFWDKIPQGIKIIQDLQKNPDAQICVEPGSSTEKFLDSLDFVKQKPMASVPEMIMDIKYKKSLAVILEPPVVARLMKKNPQLKKLEIPIPRKFQVFGCGIAIKKENRELTEQTTKAIQTLTQQGTLAKLINKWEVEG